MIILLRKSIGLRIITCSHRVITLTHHVPIECQNYSPSLTILTSRNLNHSLTLIAVAAVHLLHLLICTRRARGPDQDGNMCGGTGWSLIAERITWVMTVIYSEIINNFIRKKFVVYVCHPTNNTNCLQQPASHHPLVMGFTCRKYKYVPHTFACCRSTTASALRSIRHLIVQILFHRQYLEPFDTGKQSNK